MYLHHANDTTYTWWGTIASGEGYVGISSTAAGRLVYISFQENTYLLHPLSNRYNAQAAIDATAIPSEEPEMDVPDNITTDPSCEISYCKDVVNILVLYTPEAINELLHFFNATQKSDYGPLYWALFPQSLNYAFIQSGIVGKSARFEAEEYNFEYDTSMFILFDLYHLIADLDAWSIFSQYHADVMVLLTDDRYGSYAGIASAQYPVAIVTINNLISPRYTFAHEIGHLFGALHNRVSNGGDAKDEATECHFGYRVSILSYPDSFYTVMAQMLGPSKKRQLFFSNPNIEKGATPIGTAWDFNAAYVSETVCEIASKYYDDDELSIDITGPDTVCDETVTYSISIDGPGAGIPGNAPYSYKWYLGPSPFATPMDGILSHSLGNYSSITINTADINYNKFWIYASAHSADGVLANDVFEVENPCYQKPAHIGFYDQATEVFNIAPNPITDRLKINFLTEVGRSRYLIADACGQVVMDGILTGNHPNNPQTLPVQFPPGFYFLHLWTDSGIAAQKFIVQY